MRRPAAAATIAGASIAVAAMPIVVATARAVTGDWYPIGDNAFFALRARDVLTEHHPMLGTWTSASLSVGTDINNPGPLLFDLLALPAKVDAGGGLAIGVGVVNILAIIGIAAFAWRRAGPAMAAAAMAAATGLAWTMGSELLFDPWQPHALLFPFLCFVFAVWSMVSGDLAALPVGVFLGSLVVQTHLSYTVLVPLLSLVAFGGIVVAARRAPARRVRNVAAISVAVAILCWAQPLVDQLTGEGNLATLATSATSGRARIGPRLATQLAAWVVALPPFWGRPSFAEALYVPGLDPPPPLSVAAASLALLVVALTGVAVARRSTAAAVAALAVVGAWVTTAQLPIGALGIVPHQFKWLWPVGVFATFALVTAALRPWIARSPAPAAGVFAAVAVVLCGLSLPVWNARSGPSADAASIPVARALVDDLELEGVDVVGFDAGGLRFAEPYSTVVLLELQRRGIEFRVVDDTLARQVGSSREVGSFGDLPRLVEREGDAAMETPPGAELVARVEGLDVEERVELDDLEDEIAGYIDSVGLVLDADGRRLQAGNALPALRDAGPELRDSGALLGTAELIRIISDELAPIDRRWRGRFARYADLQQRWNTQTVALFLVPPP